MRNLCTAIGAILVGFAACSSAAPTRHAAALRLSPTAITFNSAYAEQRLLADYTEAGVTRDVTASVKLISSDPSIVSVDPDGAIRPHKNGRAQVTAVSGGARATSTVTVAGLKPGTPPSFLKDVIPVLTHAGCNMGACHGAAAGKGGFRLSLLGYDPDLDFESITRQAGARRIARSQPENSLLLRKPTYATPHRGGKRLEKGSAEYRILTDWIAAGCPGPIASDAKVVALKVTPAVRTLKRGEQQQFAVTAKYSDGTTRDATGETLFTASDESTAGVTPTGLAKANGPGEGAVIARYQGLVTTATVISPYAAPIHRAQAPNKNSNVSAAIDTMVQARLDALGLPTSPRATDGDFLRRVSLDVTGQLPSVEAAKQFLADKSPDKRTRLIDALLDSPEYVDCWTLQWADLLHCSRAALNDKGMYAMHSWIHTAVNANMPWNQFARAIIVSGGDTYRDGPSNFYKAAPTPEERAEATSQVFLGVRISCAKCHNHPYDRWTQNQYYQMAAFFSRVGTKNGENKGEMVVFAADSGETRHPKSQKVMAPCALINSQPIPADFTGDRREPLADWITSPNNPFFAHALVNRVWKRLLGRGFVDPVDDIKATTPASNRELFDWLAQDFTAHGYDVKRLIRNICLSQTYQRSAEPVGVNAGDHKFYSHYPVKRMEAEQMLDAVCSATGVVEKFAGFPDGLKAQSLPDTGTASYFLDLFGRPARTTTCACERLDDPNLSQVLHLMNSSDINKRLASKSGRISQLCDAHITDTQAVQDLYLACCTRYPGPAELQRALAAIKKAKDRRPVLEDLTWALLNSNEFMFCH